ncbi:MAG: hypothetical protein WD555_02240 [Fulvivirga sp.]
MNKFLLHTCLIFIFVIATGNTDIMAQSKGKAKNKVKENAGPPSWAPAHGYRAKTRYVYFPDHGVYYDHDRSVYISISGKNWEVSAKLPSLLSGIDLKTAVKVDLDFSDDDPQKYYANHKRKYPKHKKHKH